MLLVQKYLVDNSFGDLAKNFGVYASFSKSGCKFSLNYDQIEEKEGDLLVQECRGLILTSKDGKSFSPYATEVNGKLKYDNIIPGVTEILAYPMNRFFNYGQVNCANIDWEDPNLKVMEKLDGTLTILYFDRFINEWCVATRSVPEADIVLNGESYTFRILFEKALNDTAGISFLDFTNKLDKEITYCFELTSPYNRVVVDYKETRLTLIAARQVIYGCALFGDTWECFNELDIDNVITYGIPHVCEYTFKNANDILNWVSTLNPLEHEGVVIKDSKFNRIKIKNVSYVIFSKANHILGISERNCLELVLNNKEDDIIPVLSSEIVERIMKIKRGISNLIVEYNIAYENFKRESDKISLNDKKEFANIVLKSKDIWSAPMFTIFSGKANDMKDFLLQNKKEGIYSNNFLDKILHLIKKYN